MLTIIVNYPLPFELSELIIIVSDQIIRSVVSNSLRLHESQHAILLKNG